mgnify:FL=1
MVLNYYFDNLVIYPCQLSTINCQLSTNMHVQKEPRGIVPSKKKTLYPIRDGLRDYLIKYDREVKLPVQYTDLMRFNLKTPLRDKEGRDTLWYTVYYDECEMKELLLRTPF